MLAVVPEIEQPATTTRNAQPATLAVRAHPVLRLAGVPASATLHRALEDNPGRQNDRRGRTQRTPSPP
jgi:hypothetical protein